jgi:membrane protein YdbS with pleckstrin-like domain
MPTDVKAMLSGIALIVAGVLAYWSGSPIRPEFGTFVMITAVFMVVAMWVFPEAVGRKGPDRDGHPEPRA